MARPHRGPATRCGEGVWGQLAGFRDGYQPSISPKRIGRVNTPSVLPSEVVPSPGAIRGQSSLAAEADAN